MKFSSASLILPLLAASGLAPALAHAEQLVPAGSVINCTVSEAKISSKTEHIGDPVLCQLSHTEVYGRSTFPYGSYLVGTFDEYKDPGHFVGKGFMELKFDRLVIPNSDTVVPINARVVATPGYRVDDNGRILGNGHPTRDTIEWLIPVLWPIDLINLPRRGPRPVLKPETKLTLKVLDDFGIPTPDQIQARQPALISRQQPDYEYQQPAPVYQQPPVQSYQQPAAQSVTNVFYPPAYPQQQQYAPPPQQQQQTVIVQQQPAYRYPQRVAVPYGYPAYPPPAYPPAYYRPY